MVYPSGIIVAAEEHPLYQRSDSERVDASEVYLPLSDRDLAEDGSEHDLVTYQSAASSRG